jgi:hypothetical protein
MNRYLITFLLLILEACTGADITADAGPSRTVPCTESPGQLVTLGDDGTEIAQTIFLVAELGYETPRAVLGCYPAPTGYGRALCDERGAACLEARPSLPLAECETTEAFLIDGQYVALCGTITRTGPLDDDIEVDVPFAEVRVLADEVAQ